MTTDVIQWLICIWMQWARLSRSVSIAPVAFTSRGTISQTVTKDNKFAGDFPASPNLEFDRSHLDKTPTELKCPVNARNPLLSVLFVAFHANFSQLVRIIESSRAERLKKCCGSDLPIGVPKSRAVRRVDSWTNFRVAELGKDRPRLGLFSSCSCPDDTTRRLNSVSWREARFSSFETGLSEAQQSPRPCHSGELNTQ
jgi:hypothetical protein